jgi:hypothetical protein
MRRTAALLTALIAAIAVLLIQPTAAPAEPPCPFNCVVHDVRWAVYAPSYSHLGNPQLGKVRSDTWVNEQFATSDIGTEPYLFWNVSAVSRVAKISGAARVQVDVTRIEDVRGRVLARNARPVNSGTASYALQVSPRAEVQPFTSSYNLCGGSCCVDATTHTAFRVRTLFSIRWSDGTLGRVSQVGPWTASEWCEPVPYP